MADNFVSLVNAIIKYNPNLDAAALKKKFYEAAVNNNRISNEDFERAYTMIDQRVAAGITAQRKPVPLGKQIETCNSIDDIISLRETVAKLNDSELKQEYLRQLNKRAKEIHNGIDINQPIKKATEVAKETTEKAAEAAADAAGDAGKKASEVVDDVAKEGGKVAEKMKGKWGWVIAGAVVLIGAIAAIAKSNKNKQQQQLNAVA